MEPPPKKRKGGGIRQQLRTEVTLEDDQVFAQTGERELPPSILAKLILNLYVWALISPQLGQQIAAAAVGDLTKLQTRTIARTQRPKRMEEFTDLQKIAAIGGFGTRPNLCRRDLENLLPSMCLAMPLPVFIPLKSAAAAEGFRNCLQWIIWPHEVFSSLYHHCRSSWDKYICPGTHEIQKFWAAMRCGHGNPKLQHPAILHREGFWNYCIPLKTHGDGVPVVAGGKTWVKLADAFSWMSHLGKGSTKELVHFIWHCWVCLRCTVYEHDTYRIFSEKLQISYECIWTGEWRDRDMNGNLYQRGSIGWLRYHRMNAEEEEAEPRKKKKKKEAYIESVYRDAVAGEEVGSPSTKVWKSKAKKAAAEAATDPYS